MIQIASHADVLRGSSRVTSKNVCVGGYDPKEFLAAYALVTASLPNLTRLLHNTTSYAGYFTEVSVRFGGSLFSVITYMNRGRNECMTNET